MTTRIRVVLILIGLPPLCLMCACSTILRDLETRAGGAMDEAFKRLEKLQERSAEREAANEIEQREKRTVDERVTRIERDLGEVEVMLQETVAQFGAIETSVRQQLPKIWDRVREDASLALSRFQEESENRVLGDKEVFSHFLQHASDSSKTQANLNSLSQSVSRHVQKSERDASAIRAEIQATKDKIESSITAVNMDLQRSRRDTIMLFSAIIGGLTLVFAIYQATNAGRGSKQPAVTAK